MKNLLFLIFLCACSSATKTKSWDTGANRQDMWREEQRQEQLDTTKEQFPTGLGPTAP